MADWNIEKLLKELAEEWDADNPQGHKEAKDQALQDIQEERRKKRKGNKRGGTVSRKRGKKIMHGYKGGGKV